MKHQVHADEIMKIAREIGEVGLTQGVALSITHFFQLLITMILADCIACLCSKFAFKHRREPFRATSFEPIVTERSEGSLGVPKKMTGARVGRLTLPCGYDLRY